MGKMKELYMEIVQSRRYQDADWERRAQILKEWQESDEFKKLTYELGIRRHVRKQPKLGR